MTTTSNSLVRILGEKGLTPFTISELLDVPKHEVVQELRGVTIDPTDEDIILTSRKLALRILMEAMLIMDTGMPEVRMQVMRGFLPVFARMIGRIQDESEEEYRAAIADIFSAQRKVS